MWSDVHGNGNIQFNQKYRGNTTCACAKIHERGILCGWYWNILEIHERSCFDYGVIASQFDMLGEQEMADRLKDGNLIICAMGPGDFTNSGHFIVIYDYSRKKFSVNDPFSYTNSSKNGNIRP